VNWLVSTHFKVLGQQPCSCGRSACEKEGAHGLVCVRFFKAFEIGINTMTWGVAKDDMWVKVGRKLGYAEAAIHGTILLAIAFAIAGVL